MADSLIEFSNPLDREIGQYKLIAGEMVGILLRSNPPSKELNAIGTEMFGLLLEACFLNGRHAVVREFIRIGEVHGLPKELKDSLMAQNEDMARQVKIIDVQLQARVTTIQ